MKSSIWSIPEGWEGMYLLLFVLQVAGWTSLLSWRTACCGTEEAVLDVVLAIGQGVAPVMITSAGSSMIIVEGIVIFAEKFLKKRYVEGREKGRREGMEEGEASANAKWKAWYVRQLEAKAKGEEEPPPPSSDSD